MYTCFKIIIFNVKKTKNFIYIHRCGLLVDLTWLQVVFARIYKCWY